DSVEVVLVVIEPVSVSVEHGPDGALRLVCHSFTSSASEPSSCWVNLITTTPRDPRPPRRSGFAPWRSRRRRTSSEARGPRRSRRPAWCFPSSRPQRNDDEPELPSGLVLRHDPELDHLDNLRAGHRRLLVALPEFAFVVHRVRE